MTKRYYIETDDDYIFIKLSEEQGRYTYACTDIPEELAVRFEKAKQEFLNLQQEIVSKQDDGGF